MNTKISVALITMNEEANIERCLNSVKWADEIIVIDSGSTDRTVEIAREFTDKVYYQKWLGYAEQRNVSLRKATGDWVLIIDADEEVTAELQASIQRAVNSGENKVAYAMMRKNYFMGQVLNSYIESKLRLFKNGSVIYRGQVHEKAIFSGNVGKLQGILYHHQYVNLEFQLNKLNNYSTLAAKDLYNAGKKYNWSRLVFRPVFEFIKRYIIKGGFLDGLPGFVAAVLRAYYTFAKYVKLYEIQKTARSVDRVD